MVAIASGEDNLALLSTVQLPGGNFPLTVAVEPEGKFAFVAHIVDHKLSIISLYPGTVETRAIEWLSAPGPSYVAVQP
jgi:DNA-binding beta-propeller fold protein YncE